MSSGMQGALKSSRVGPFARDSERFVIRLLIGDNLFNSVFNALSISISHCALLFETSCSRKALTGNSITPQSATTFGRGKVTLDFVRIAPAVKSGCASTRGIVLKLARQMIGELSKPASLKERAKLA
jgi:hypothetical protein